MMKQGQNTGAIEAKPRSTDFVATGETALFIPEVNPTMLWIKDEPPGEWQKDVKADFETDACVSFAANDMLETYGDFQIRNNMLSSQSVQWLKDNGYFNANGTLNFSDRFLAKISGTTEAHGNSLPVVWQSIRDNGCVPESMWPFPMEEINADPTNAWEIYYKDIPQSVRDMGKEFLKHFEVMYEWVFTGDSYTNVDAVKNYLKQSPVQILTEVCWPWNVATPINGCGPGHQHSTLLTGVDTVYHILDHYVPFNKELTLDYSLTYGMRGLIRDRVRQVCKPHMFTSFQTPLKFGDAVSGELRLLQLALQQLGYMRKNLFGPYGPQTRTAIAAFQKDQGILGDNGNHFGPKTRAALNETLKQHDMLVNQTSTSGVGVVQAAAPIAPKVQKGITFTRTNNVLNWILKSSANPQEGSLTIKAILVAAIPTLMAYSHVVGINLSNAEVTALVNNITASIQTLLFIVSTYMFVKGLVRKVYLTIFG